LKLVSQVQSRNSKLSIAYLILSIISLYLVFQPILNSSYVGDDWPNSQTPDLIRWRFGEKNLVNLWSEIAFWNEQWFRGQGRVYSIQFIENRLIFYIFEDPHLYKIFQFSINLLAVLVCALLIYKVTKSINISSLFIVMFAAVFQIRPDFDPHLAFGGMLPSMMIKIFLTIILSIYYVTQKKPRKLIGFLVVFVWVSAMFTYEYSWLCLPAVIAIIVGYKYLNSSVLSINTTIVKQILLGLTSSTLLIALSVFGIFKPRAVGVSEAYNFRFAFPESLKTYVKQTYAAVPGSVDNIMFTPVDFNNYPISNRSIFVIGMLLILLFSVFLDIFVQENDIKNMKMFIVLLVFGFLLLTSFGLIIAGQPVWWDKFTFGSSYLGVYVGEFGLAIILISFYGMAFIVLKNLVKRYRLTTISN
jgi:hypothetical protein